MSEPLKKEEGKPRMELIDPVAIEDLAQVLTMGAKKHSPNGWRRGIDMPDGDALFTGALLRHVNALQKGEVFDDESGLPHAADVMCNAMFLT